VHDAALLVTHSAMYVDCMETLLLPVLPLLLPVLLLLLARHQPPKPLQSHLDHATGHRLGEGHAQLALHL
jgi:hypothetical protein